MHQFCVQCGAKNIYESTQPKFCCGCGSPFNRSVASVSKNENVDSEDDFEEPTSFNKESLAKDWSIQGNYNDNKLTVGAYALNPSPTVYSPRSSPFSSMSEEDVLRQTIQECSKVSSSKDVTGGR